jgi:hypothetical protein
MFEMSALMTPVGPQHSGIDKEYNDFQAHYLSS